MPRQSSDSPALNIYRESLDIYSTHAYRVFFGWAAGRWSAKKAIVDPVKQSGQG